MRHGGEDKPDCVQALLDCPRTDPNRGKNRDGSGRTALMFAAENGEADCVRALLADARTNPMLKNRPRGKTARDWAAYNRHRNCENLLRLAEQRWVQQHGSTGWSR